MDSDVRPSTRVFERRIQMRDGCRVRVEDRNEQGAGPPILLLHGFTGSVDAWGEGLLDALSVTRRVVAMDFVGHGGSDTPSHDDRYRIDEALRDIEEVLDSLEIGAAIWVGYSMGGRVALAGGILKPERVAALVLESTSPGLADEGERSRRSAEDADRARRLEEHGLEAFVDEWLDHPLFQSQVSLPEPVRSEARARRLEGSAEGFARSLRGLSTGAQPSFWERIDALDRPALVLTGALDEKFDRIGNRMAELMPRAQRRSVSGAGHAVHFERPSAWMAEVLDFLERTDLPFS